MAESNTIKLNPTKPSTIEFDVTVSGLEGVPPDVRFVIHRVGDVDWTIKCAKIDGGQWQAKFPTFPEKTSGNLKFCIEVIVDEYYFVPATGEITFVTSPDVSFKEKGASKPTVTTSFVVNQDDEPKLASKKKVVKEAASGGGEVVDHSAPTNRLLVPEENPEFKQSSAKIALPDIEHDDFIDKSRLDNISDDVVPGEGKEYAQDDRKEDEYDPKRVAENILKQTVGGVSAPTTRGSLFKRDASGHIIVPGLESQTQLNDKEERGRKVRDIIGK